MKKHVKALRWVAVSGGFDPIHVGHARMFKEARALGDKLVVIINNDHWLRAKKGYVFMPQTQRKELIASFPFVDKPTVVVMCAGIGISMPGSDGKFIGKHGRPFFPGEITLCRQSNRQRKGLGLPGFGENGSVLIAWQARQGRKSLGLNIRIRPVQDDCPIGRRRQSPEASCVSPTTRAR